MLILLLIFKMYNFAYLELEMALTVSCTSCCYLLHLHVFPQMLCSLLHLGCTLPSSCRLLCSWICLLCQCWSFQYTDFCGELWYQCPKSAFFQILCSIRWNLLWCGCSHSMHHNLLFWKNPTCSSPVWNSWVIHC